MVDAVQLAQVHRSVVGDLTVTVLSDGLMEFPSYAVGAAGALPPELDAVLRAQGVPGDGRVSLGLNVAVIDTGEHRVLLDAGGGGLLPGTGALGASLHAAGIAPESVDVLVLSHLHPDHVGGALDADGRPVFPRARIVLPRADADFWSQEPELGELPVDDGLRESLRAAPRTLLPALGERAELIAPDAQIVPGIAAVPAVGHTPGHVAVEARSGSAVLLYLADAMTVPAIQFARTDWVGPVDNWPAQSVLTRRRLLDRAARDGALVLAAHFPFPGLGRVTGHGDARWTWTPEA